MAQGAQAMVKPLPAVRTVPRLHLHVLPSAE